MCLPRREFAREASDLTLYEVEVYEGMINLRLSTLPRVLSGYACRKDNNAARNPPPHGLIVFLALA